MKTAFSYWEHRIAPVFDTSRNLQIIVSNSGHILFRTEAILTEEIPLMRAQHLCNLEIDTLVCGALSKPLHNLVVSCGIRVVPFVAGDLEDVVRAWLNKQLEMETFGMPGCRRRCGLHEMNEEEQGREKSDQSLVETSGQNQLASGVGRKLTRSQRQAGTAGLCCCPYCGHSESHERGTACGQKRCPACGTALIRL